MTTHSIYSASTSERWMACAGSVALSQSILAESGPLPTSAFAAEGTLAHKLAEEWLRTNKMPSGDPEMLEHVGVFVRLVRGLQQMPGALALYEHRVSLDVLQPAASMWGTADALVLWPDGTLHVCDLKYGTGVVVRVEENTQLQMYALGALLAFAGEVVVERVVLHICQPRVSTEPQMWDIPAPEVLAFGGRILDRVQAIEAGDTTLAVGAHCRFCPALARCPAQQTHAMEVAQNTFAAPPIPELLSTEQLVTALRAAPIIEGWLSQVRAHAQRMLEQGREVPGFKLVPKRANREWVDEAQALDYFHTVAGLPKDVLVTTKVKSPAQMEKMKLKVPEDLVQRISSGATLAPVEDARPAVSGEPQFPVLPPSPTAPLGRAPEMDELWAQSR